MAQNEAGRLVNMTVSPLLENNKWRKSAIDLATILHVTPDILWPDHLRRVISSRSMAEIEVSLDDAIRISSPNSEPSLLLENREIAETLLGELTDRERAVIALRMDGATLKEAGRELGNLGMGAVSGARLRQIEAKAHRKMKRKALTAFGAKSLADL
jgi:hypothetical protein